MSASMEQQGNDDRARLEEVAMALGYPREMASTQCNAVAEFAASMRQALIETQRALDRSADHLAALTRARDAAQQEPADVTRLREQALAISELLRDAGIGPCSLPAGVMELRERADAAEQQLAAARQRGMATEYAWPQDVAGLIDMAGAWPLPESDAGDLFSGDVLIHKLGNALNALAQQLADRTRAQAQLIADLRTVATFARAYSKSPLSNVGEALQRLDRYTDELAAPAAVSPIPRVTPQDC